MFYSEFMVCTDKFVWAANSVSFTSSLVGISRRPQSCSAAYDLFYTVNRSSSTIPLEKLVRLIKKPGISYRPLQVGFGLGVGKRRVKARILG